ncbi:hypothetical protein Mapa_003660 [Marchantia paleacea]|nr:hypothetical protein Mapa_003660 [Marchantia paleacea]
MPETVHKHDKQPLSSSDPTFITTQKASTNSLWTNHALLASVAVYSLWSVADVATTEVFISASIFVFNMTLFPSIERYLGPLLLARISAIMCAPVIILFPLVSSLHGTTRWVVLNVLALTRTSLIGFIITASFILTNNSVPTEQRGAANGLSVGWGCLSRALGPAIAGTVFAWSQNRKDPKFLQGSWLVFSVIEIFVILGILTTCPPCLLDSANRPYYISHPQGDQESGNDEANKC